MTSICRTGIRPANSPSHVLSHNPLQKVLRTPTPHQSLLHSHLLRPHLLHPHLLRLTRSPSSATHVVHQLQPASDLQTVPTLRPIATTFSRSRHVGCRSGDRQLLPVPAGMIRINSGRGNVSTGLHEGAGLRIQPSNSTVISALFKSCLRC